MPCNHKLLNLVVVPTSPFNGTKGMFFSMFVEGGLPSKAQKQFGRGRVWMPSECMAWRGWVADQLRDKVKIRGHRPILVRDVVFTIVADPPPDRDTVYHQLQDALTQDIFKPKLDDKWTGHVNIIPFVPTNKTTCFYSVSGEYLFEKVSK